MRLALGPVPDPPGTASALVTTPEWMPHLKHKSPCYALCIPIHVYPTQIQECGNDDLTNLDAENLNKLKLHLLSLDGLKVNADYVDSEEEDDDYDGTEVNVDLLDTTVHWTEIAV